MAGDFTYESVMNMERDKEPLTMKPIIFNTEMTRAIMEGRKIVTRRAMKPQPELVGRFWVFGDARWSDTVRTVTPLPGHTLYNRATYRHGDILWVRETWRKRNGQYEYRADDECLEGWRNMVPWRPSIHMPREAARIFLRVLDLRVERLQEITEDDAKAEGAVKSYPYADPETGEPAFMLDEKGTYRCGFSAIWNSTIKPTGLTAYSWNANPWVWAIKFERISKEEASR